MLIIHKRKKSLQDNEPETPMYNSKIENINNRNSQNNRKHFSLSKKTNSPIEKNHKYSPLKKLRINSPPEQSQNTKYSRNTFNHLHITSNNPKTSDNNYSKRKIEVGFPRIIGSLNNQYNLSDMNSNSKTLEIPFSLYNNLKSIQNSKKNNSISINVENNNKILVDEELSNQKYKNHQTKSTKISKIKVLQKEKSQEQFHKRLLINSASSPHKRNNNSIVYSAYKNNIDDKKDKNINKSFYNNHKYFDSSYTRKNNSLNKRNITTNNIITNRRSSNSNFKDKEKKKENEKEKIDIKRPKIVIKISEPKEDDNDDDSENLDNIANSLSSLNLNPLETFGQPKTPIFLSPLIFSSYHSKFKPSIYSTDNEFNRSDFIKAYAYNSNEGNIRDYNEDTITVTKIFLNTKDKSNYFYFFAIYDGHGGNGCSLYLKNNLHKNITELSVKGIKNAISETEKNFLEKVAVNSNGNLADTSGSCGVMVLIKNRKCIIANLGDSRCVLYRNKRAVFSTRDHKPNTDFERKRIELAGGSIYQTQSTIPLYQNGKLIEIPWRVLPGGLSVSRTFGDIESKDIKFGGKKGVVAALPDIAEFELNEEYNFIVIGCDGIFDVLSNMEIMECIKIVLKINKNKRKKINELCADFASMIIKSALAKESFDNVSCIVIVFNINDLI